MNRTSWWCEQGRCFSCTYARCSHRCHDGQLAPIAARQLDEAADQASADLARYFDTSTSWRGYAHAGAIAAHP